MFTSAPLPLSPDVPLSHLLALSRRTDPLGAWVAACRHQVRIYRLGERTGCQVLASPDLGFLLGHCGRVAVTQNRHVEVLPSEAVIQWRALQVVTTTPYLPRLERMRALFPRLRMTSSGFQVPLWTESAEEVLARCVSEGLRVRGSRVVNGAGSDEYILPVVPRPP